MTLRFVGTDYHGSQIQHNAPTVQQTFQQALARVLGQAPPIKCCSRTDAGVHANMFCISISCEGAPSDEGMVMGLNGILPPTIRVTGCRRVPEDFHARYSCVGKRYRYLVANSRVLDPFLYGRAVRFWPEIHEQELEHIAQVFVGTHDFRAFCGAKNEVEDTVRTVTEFRVLRDGELVQFLVSADGFLYHMVRILVGTLLNAARGKLTREEIAAILRDGKRTNLCMTAPAQGLYLDFVDYGETITEARQ